MALASYNPNLELASYNTWRWEHMSNLKFLSGEPSFEPDPELIRNYHESISSSSGQSSTDKKASEVLRWVAEMSRHRRQDLKRDTAVSIYWD